MQADLLVPVLQQEIELAEYLGEIPPIDLVDDEEDFLFRFVLRQFRGMQKRPVPQFETGSPTTEHRTKSLHEVLICVRRMELHERDAFSFAGEAFRQLSRGVGLAGAGWPLQDDLPLVIE